MNLRREQQGDAQKLGYMPQQQEWRVSGSRRPKSTLPEHVLKGRLAIEPITTPESETEAKSAMQAELESIVAQLPQMDRGWPWREHKIWLVNETASGLQKSDRMKVVAERRLVAHGHRVGREQFRGALWQVEATPKQRHWKAWVENIQAQLDCSRYAGAQQACDDVPATISILSAI
jgi:hypothetical protein